MEEKLLSRGQRRMVRRAKDEKPMTFERFWSKAQNAGLIVGGRLAIDIEGRGVTKFDVNKLPDGSGIRLSWVGGYTDVTALQYAQHIIGELGQRRLPQSDV
jgi:hypothetical protein